MHWTIEALDELERLAQAAVQEEWQTGYSGTSTHQDALDWLKGIMAKSDNTDIHCVFVGNPEVEEDTRIVAVTGNGPNSAAHAHYLYAVQPAHILALIREVRKLVAAVKEAQE